MHACTSILPGTRARLLHTAASFEVDDVQAVVSELRERGIVFEDYDMPGLKTVNGVAELDGEYAAWFRDPDGN